MLESFFFQIHYWIFAEEEKFAKDNTPSNFDTRYAIHPCSNIEYGPQEVGVIKASKVRSSGYIYVCSHLEIRLRNYLSYFWLLMWRMADLSFGQGYQTDFSILLLSHLPSTLPNFILKTINNDTLLIIYQNTKKLYSNLCKFYFQW